MAQQLESILPEKAEQNDDLAMKHQQQMLNKIRRVKQKIQKKEALLQTKDVQLKSFLEQVRVHVKNEKDRFAQETAETKAELEDLPLELQPLKEGKDMPKENDEMTLDALLSEGEDKKDPQDQRVLKEQLHAARDEAAQAQMMAYSMKQQLDALTAQFLGLKHLQPAGLTPPPSEETSGFATPAVGPPGLGGLQAVPSSPTMVRDAKAPFRVKVKERSGPYSPVLQQNKSSKTKPDAAKEGGGQTLPQDSMD